MLNDGKGLLKPYKHTPTVSHNIFVSAQDGFDFCIKFGIEPTIAGGSLNAMTKEEQFDGEPCEINVHTYVSVYITDHIEFTVYITSLNNEHEKWQKLWREYSKHWNKIEN